MLTQDVVDGVDIFLRVKDIEDLFTHEILGGGKLAVANFTPEDFTEDELLQLENNNIFWDSKIQRFIFEDYSE